MTYFRRASSLPGPNDNNMEPVTVFTICEFFAKYPERLKKATKAYEANRVQAVQVNKEGYFKGKVQASMKKRQYNVQVCVSFALNFEAICCENIAFPCNCI